MAVDLSLQGPALLFCPADRGDRYAKALSAADSVILDLEDAVAPADKASAREQLVAAGAASARGDEGALDPARVIVRVNPADTIDHPLDLAAVAETPYRTLMLAKAESATQLDALQKAGYRVLALCETAAGIARVAEIAAHPAVFALMWGAEDLAASMGGKSSRLDPADGAQTGIYRDFARFARTRMLIEAKAAGKLAVDSVFVNIPDADGLRAEATDASASGFDATACIHPSQAAILRSAYAASPEEMAWAERVLDEATRQPGVFRFEGKMVDEPVLRQARAMLSR
ncbi:CoA ester lyase [Leucobacter sp. UT-8R-CII-1-4]|uniref:HpcH/HpaI aldolase/citrate lyase family protein n=1 Tax=Leucobacter sp. UT-8R-CII-1-4 TaxID=3040075 RepID=UPI0024A920A5|nr:CoA ester lyase [Leucobacter sp. UT-8R-CII-1-4]MDI6022570.1 CoA ester lyase [Leucobacter sp. UT-8R-CII-1-4]